jgi:hypothetical protein
MKDRFRSYGNRCLLSAELEIEKEAFPPPFVSTLIINLASNAYQPEQAAAKK